MDWPMRRRGSARLTAKRAAQRHEHPRGRTPNGVPSKRKINEMHVLPFEASHGRNMVSLIEDE